MTTTRMLRTALDAVAAAITEAAAAASAEWETHTGMSTTVIADPAWEWIARPQDFAISPEGELYGYNGNLINQEIIDDPALAAEQMRRWIATIIDGSYRNPVEETLSESDREFLRKQFYPYYPQGFIGEANSRISTSGKEFGWILVCRGYHVTLDAADRLATISFEAATFGEAAKKKEEREA